MGFQNHTGTITVSGKGREDQLQFLRFLAFLNVFIAHAEQWMFFPYRASHSASAAVSFFFMLSGVVAGYSLVGKPIAPNVCNVAVFVWKKVQRIYPLYFLTTLFALMFSEIPSLLMECDFVGLRAPLIQLGKNLLLIQSWFPEGGHSYNTVGWFLSVLVFLHALSLPFAWILKKLMDSRYRNMLLPGLFVGISFGMVFYCYVSQSLDMSFWHYQFPPARMGEYFLGMILGFCARPTKSRIPEGKIWRAGFTVVEIAVLLFWYHSLSRPGNYWRNYIISWMMPNILVIAVFLAGCGWVSWMFKRKELVYLGDISFECYLLHQQLLIRFAVNLSGKPASLPGNVFIFLFSLLFSILMACYIHEKRK